MYSVSTDYINKITSSSIDSTWYGTIVTKSNTIYNITANNIKSNASKLSWECISGDNMEIGTANARELDIQLYLDYNSVTGKYYLNGIEVDRYDFYGAVVSLTFRLYLDLSDPTDPVYEDVPLGSFDVSVATRKADVLTLKAFDWINRFVNKPVIIADNATPFELIQLACNTADITLGMTSSEFNTFPNHDRTYFPYEPDTYISDCQDLLRYACQLLNVIAYMGRDDKLYVKSYSMTTIRTISSGWRYNSEFADYEVHYSKMTSKDIPEKIIIEKVIPGDNGLTYELGTNPFLQFGTRNNKETSINAMLAQLNTITHTPFEAKTPIDPALDILDTLEFTDNQAVAGKKCIPMKISYALNGSMTLIGAGENPNLVTQNRRSNELKELENSIDAKTIYFYNFTNASEIQIADTEEKVICTIQYTSLAKTIVTYEAEILLETETKYSANTYYDLEVTVKYRLNELVDTDYQPIETYVDGKHILHLLYQITIQTASVNKLEVLLSCNGGSAIIKERHARSRIYGQSLAATDIWDGTIDIRQDISRMIMYLPSPMAIRGLTDTVSCITQTTADITISQAINRLSMSSPISMQINGITESIVTETTEVE